MLFRSSVEKKKPFRHNKSINKTPPLPGAHQSPDNVKKKNFARKFIEQQATKEFIKKDNKPAGKSKLKLKGPIDKRDFKLTVSRALNVEEIEIKQRSLAAVKRARLKEKKNSSETEDKKEYKKVIKEVKIPEQITIQELSNRMAEKSSEIIKFLFNKADVFLCQGEKWKKFAVNSLNINPNHTRIISNWSATNKL